MVRACPAPAPISSRTHASSSTLAVPRGASVPVRASAHADRPRRRGVFVLLNPEPRRPVSERTSTKLRHLVGVAGEIAASVIAPRAEREDAEALWPQPAMRALADAGLNGLHVPEALGGRGEGLAGLVAVAEVLARESPSTALCYAMHCVGTAVIAAKATDHQKQAYLEPIARGEHVTTIALSEPGTGAHFYIPQTRLTREDDGFVLDGTKSFVTNGGQADSYVVSTATEAEGGMEGAFSCVLVDHGAPGLEWQDQWLGMGMRSNSSLTVRLEGLRVPHRNLLGDEGDQLWYVFEVVAPYFLMAMAGTYLGLAQASLDDATEHLRTRRHAHTGRSLAMEPVLQHRLGVLWAQLESTRRLVYWAADEADARGARALPALAAAKAQVADCAVTVTNETMTVMGGIGYRDRSDAERRLRDARAAHVMSPTTDLLRTWTGRALLDIPLLGS